MKTDSVGISNGIDLKLLGIAKGGSGLGPELVADSDMEAVGVASWADYGTPTTKEKSSAQAHSGTQSLHLVTDANFEGARQATLSVVSGKTYRCTAWAYVVSGSVILRVTIGAGSTDVGTTSTTGQWIQFTEDILSDSTGVETVQLDTRTGEAYWDDVSVREML